MVAEGVHPAMARHVLVPMDVSERSRAALEFALSHYGDDVITVLHVTNPLEDAYFASEEEFYTRVDVFEDQAAAKAEQIFADAREKATEYGVTVRTASAFGAPATAIVEFATEEAVDHIVIGSHGRSGVARLLLGSVAEKVARQASVPVTIVK